MELDKVKGHPNTRACCSIGGQTSSSIIERIIKLETLKYFSFIVLCVYIGLFLLIFNNL